MPEKRQLVAFLLIVSAVALAVVMWLAASLWNAAHPPHATRLEVFKSGLQLLVVVVLGGAASFLVSQLTRAQQDRAALHESRHAMLIDFEKAYADAKTVRRLMRGEPALATYSVVADKRKAVCRQTIGADSRAALRGRLIDMLIDAQLALERLEEQLTTDRPIFDEQQHMAGHLRTMQKYLNKVADDCLWVCVQGTESDAPISTVQTPLLCDFIGPYDTSRFRHEFSEPHRHAVKLIATTLAHG